MALGLFVSYTIGQATDTELQRKAKAQARDVAVTL
jgi:hypothetical protein